MILFDVNVVVYAFRADAEDHSKYRAWLDAIVNGDEAFGVVDLVMSGFLRVVTHPRVFSPPTPMAEALRFVQIVRSRPNAVVVSPGERHWEIFARLCTGSAVKGNLVPDAFLAALAIESGSEWITTDRDFNRFAGLRVRHPLQ